jgi:hypothetical protein
MQIRIQVKCQYEIIQFPSNHTHTQNKAQILNHTHKKENAQIQNHTHKQMCSSKIIKKKKLHTKY